MLVIYCLLRQITNLINGVGDVIKFSGGRGWLAMRAFGSSS